MTQTLKLMWILVIVPHVSGVKFVYDSLSVPCSFWDSVNITDADRLANGSYLYEDRILPETVIGTYNYEFINLTVKRFTQPHLRVCICTLMECVRLCCPMDQYFDHRLKECKKPPVKISTLVNITTLENSTDIDVEINEAFGFVYGRPCERMYHLDPATFDYDKWELFKNGTILRHDDQTYLSKNEYCMSPTPTFNSSVMTFNPFVCFSHVETARYFVYGIAMLTSIPFLIITIFIYLILPELRNLHGKALCCYLSCLVVGYSCLGHTLIEGGVIAKSPLCEFLGYTAYFSFMSSFLWLSVISFDLWWNFRIMASRGPRKEMKRFVMYSLYAWGLSLCFTLAVYAIQKSDIPDYFKPGIGGGQRCWIDANSWMQLFYFYGQVIVLITFNIVMFVLTTHKIHHIKRETLKVMSREDSRRNINRDKDNVGLFLRLFIVMGVTWSTDIISWLIGKRYEVLFYLTDICNAIQGLIIFILFVMKNKVKQLIIKKYNSVRGIRGRESKMSQYSVKTSSATLAITHTSTLSSMDNTDISLIPIADKQHRTL